MRQGWTGRIAIVLAVVVTAAACGGDEGGGEEAVDGFELLMAATYGDPDTGSFSPDRIEDAIRHRSRHTITNDAAMNPPAGFGHCMNGGGTDPAAVFNLNRIYILDKESGLAAQDPASPLADQLQQNIADVRERLQAEIEPREEREFSVQPIDLFYPEEPTVEGFIAQVNGILADIDPGRVDVALDYYFAPSMIYGFAADDPTPVPEGTTSESIAAAQVGADGGHTIWIADYGLPIDSDKNGWSGMIDGEESQANPVGGDPIPAFYAHSVMVASVAAQVAPENPVFVIDATEEILGTRAITVAALDSGLLRNQVLAEDPGVLNLSFGAYDCTVVEAANGDRLAVSTDNSFTAALQRVLAPYTEAMPVVAAAGNDASSAPIYPAALEKVVAVGAVDTTVLNTLACLTPADIEAWSAADRSADENCRPDPTVFAPFTNTGASQTEQRPGVDLVVDYPVVDASSPYAYLGGLTAALDTGLVRVSGTSLAAPFHAACLTPDGAARC